MYLTNSNQRQSNGQHGAHRRDEARQRAPSPLLPAESLFIQNTTAYNYGVNNDIDETTNFVRKRLYARYIPSAQFLAGQFQNLMSWAQTASSANGRPLTYEAKIRCHPETGRTVAASEVLYTPLEEGVELGQPLSAVISIEPTPRELKQYLREELTSIANNGKEEGLKTFLESVVSGNSSFAHTRIRTMGGAQFTDFAQAALNAFFAEPTGIVVYDLYLASGNPEAGEPAVFQLDFYHPQALEHRFFIQFELEWEEGYYSQDDAQSPEQTEED